MPNKRKKYISFSEHEALTESPSDQPTRAVSNPFVLKNAFPVEIRPRRTVSENVWNPESEHRPRARNAAELQALHESDERNRRAQNTSSTNAVPEVSAVSTEAGPKPLAASPTQQVDFEAERQEDPALPGILTGSSNTNLQPPDPQSQRAGSTDSETDHPLGDPDSQLESNASYPLDDTASDVFQSSTALLRGSLPQIESPTRQDLEFNKVVGGPLSTPGRSRPDHPPGLPIPSGHLGSPFPSSFQSSDQGSVLKSKIPPTLLQGLASSDAMATAPFRMSADGRRPNRYENRAPSSSVLCRNGPQCRKYQEGTCNYNHDFGNSMALNGLNNASKKSLNVDSPAFTPKTSNAQLAKIGISPKAAAAATFTPRGSGSVTPAANSHSKDHSGDFSPPQIFQPAQQTFQEFFPGQSFLGSQQSVESQANLQAQLSAFNDPFAQQTLAGMDPSQATTNPYAQQLGHAAAQTFFQDSTGFRPQPNYHLYASIGPRRDDLQPYQRSVTDFFIPDDLREDLQRKSEASLQTFANSTLPRQLEHFHSLVALDTNNSRGQSTFGYPSWIYKAISSRDGCLYALRRIEGFRLNNEAAIRTVASWKRINHSGLVQIRDAFTTRVFDDSSLIIVTAYHPCSTTLAEKHFGIRLGSRQGSQVTPENELWGYIVQIATALKTIHEAKLAAQTVMASKVIITSKNRVRLNGCAVFDVLRHDQQKPLDELQRADMVDLGRLILSIAARNINAPQNAAKSLELVSRTYSERLRSVIAWLLTPPTTSADTPQQAEVPPPQYNINTLLGNIVDKVLTVYDSGLHFEDELQSQMMSELENGRIARLMIKLNMILERPETGSSLTGGANPAQVNNSSQAWSEIGDRYCLKLFRDYVFHQVDSDGRPVTNLGHVIDCLNKLDAGVDEKIRLVSRDEQNMMICSYKELKRCFEGVWSEILKAQARH